MKLSKFTLLIWIFCKSYLGAHPSEDSLAPTSSIPTIGKSISQIDFDVSKLPDKKAYVFESDGIREINNRQELASLTEEFLEISGNGNYEWQGDRKLKFEIETNTRRYLGKGNQHSYYAACTSCGFLVIYDTQTRQTYLAHSMGIQSIAHWKKALAQAKNKFGSKNKDVVVYLGGTDWTEEIGKENGDIYQSFDEVPETERSKTHKRASTAVQKHQRDLQKFMEELASTDYQVISSIQDHVNVASYHMFQPETGTLYIECHPGRFDQFYSKSQFVKIINTGIKNAA